MGLCWAAGEEHSPTTSSQTRPKTILNPGSVANKKKHGIDRTRPADVETWTSAGPELHQNKKNTCRGHIQNTSVWLQIRRNGHTHTHKHKTKNTKNTKKTKKKLAPELATPPGPTHTHSHTHTRTQTQTQTHTPTI